MKQYQNKWNIHLFLIKIFSVNFYGLVGMIRIIMATAVVNRKQGDRQFNNHHLTTSIFPAIFRRKKFIRINNVLLIKKSQFGIAM